MRESDSTGSNTNGIRNDAANKADILNIREIESDKRSIQLMASQPPEEELRAAIRNGLAQGRRSEGGFRRRRIGLSMAAGMVAALLLLTAFTRVSPAFASMLHEVPLFGKFVDAITSDSSLELAAKNEFVQPVNVSDERDGKKFTVHFIMTDGHRMVLFYSLTGTGVTEETQLSKFDMSGVDGEELPAGYMTWGAPDDSDLKNEKYDKVDIRLTTGLSFPERVTFKAEASGTVFRTEFAVDRSLFDQMREEYDVDKEFAIGDQRYHVGHVVITPLQAEVEIKALPGNTKQTQMFGGVALEDEQGRRWTSNFGMGTYDEGKTEYFYSSYFVRPKHLTLVIDGANQTERGRKLVVDTEKGLTLESPDQRLRLLRTDRDEEGDRMRLTIEISNLNKDENAMGSTLIDISKPFMDGSGKAYMLLTDVTTSYSGSSNEQNGTHEQTFSIPLKEYKQPLTFELYSYPNYVKQRVEVPIR